MDRRTDSYIDGRTDSYIDRRTDSYIDGRTNSYIDRWTNCYIDRRTDSYKDRRTNSYIDKHSSHVPFMYPWMFLVHFHTTDEDLRIQSDEAEGVSVYLSLPINFHPKG